jgi:hypothetical protein
MPTSDATQQPTKGYLGYNPDHVGDTPTNNNYLASKASNAVANPTPETDLTTLTTVQAALGGWTRFGKLGARKG